MANMVMGNPDLGFPSRVKSDPYSNEPNLTNLTSVFNMRARLQVINAAYYTNAMLDIMSINDMIYAIRVADLPATL